MRRPEGPKKIGPKPSLFVLVFFDFRRFFSSKKGRFCSFLIVSLCFFLVFCLPSFLPLPFSVFLLFLVFLAFFLALFLSFVAFLLSCFLFLSFVSSYFSVFFLLSFFIRLYLFSLFDGCFPFFLRYFLILLVLLLFVETMLT